ncbi:MAG: hypothetical protein R3E32_04975 [Chitinophagales bacterium]
MDNQLSIYFDLEHHLNDRAKSLYIEALNLNRLAEIPRIIYVHAQKCAYCTIQLYELYEALEGVNYLELGKHPLLDNGLSNLRLSNNIEDIDAILERLIADAIVIPAYEEMISTTYRNSVVDGRLVVLHPENEQLCIGFISFRFSTNTGIGFILTLENHLGRVFKTRIAASETEYTLSFEPKDQFPSGLYYWKLALKGGSPMMIGKVFVYN